MTNFKIHDSDSAPEASKPFLDSAEAKFGMVPNLIGVLAESPAAVEAYLHLSTLAGKTDFSPEERTIVWMTINHESSCHYCMAAHTAIAKGEKIADDVIEATRTGSAQKDQKLEALRQFTLAVVRERGWVPEDEVQKFLDAGFTRRHVLDVVTIASQKLISNYTNHLARTPVDQPFRAFAWEADTATA